MENGSYKELEKDLLKYVEKYTTRWYICSQYLQKLTTKIP
jgi:hypothetical protein